MCRLDRRPTNEEAEVAGFLDARSWYLYSSKERGLDAMVGEQNFDSLPSSETPEPPYDDGHADVWAYKRGEVVGGDEQMYSIMFPARERATAANGHGVAEDPEYPESVRLLGNADKKIRELGDQIRDRKERLKSLGWTRHQIQERYKSL